MKAFRVLFNASFTIMFLATLSSRKFSSGSPSPPIVVVRREIDEAGNLSSPSGSTQKTHTGVVGFAASCNCPSE